MSQLSTDNSASKHHFSHTQPIQHGQPISPNATNMTGNSPWSKPTTSPKPSPQPDDALSDADFPPLRPVMRTEHRLLKSPTALRPTLEQTISESSPWTRMGTHEIPQPSVSSTYNSNSSKHPTERSGENEQVSSPAVSHEPSPSPAEASLLDRLSRLDLSTIPSNRPGSSKETVPSPEQDDFPKPITTWAEFAKWNTSDASKRGEALFLPLPDEITALPQKIISRPRRRPKPKKKYNRMKIEMPVCVGDASPANFAKIVIPRESYPVARAPIRVGKDGVVERHDRKKSSLLCVRNYEVD